MNDVEPGLREAARVARHQAAVAREQAARPHRDPGMEELLIAQARTAEALARTFEALANEAAEKVAREVTQPRALLLRECAVCGATIPSSWTPPTG